MSEESAAQAETIISAPLDVATSTAADLPASSGETVEDNSAPETPDVQPFIDSSDFFNVSDEEFTDVIEKLDDTEKKAATPADDIAPEILPDEAKKNEAESVTEETQTAEVITEGETPEPKTEGEPPEVKTETATDVEDTLKWETAPEHFRERHKALKDEVKTLRENSLERQFLIEPEKFLENLEGKSESQFQTLVQLASNKAAQANPSGWIDVFVENYPDLVAQKLLGDEKLTRNRLIAERETVDEELFAEWEDEKPALDTPEKLELERLKQADKERGEQEHLGKRQELLQRIAQPMTDAVNETYRDARLEVDEKDSPTVKSFKNFINEMTPFCIQNRLASDEEIAPVYNQVNGMIEKLDEAGAKQLQMTLVSYVEDITNGIAEFATDLIANSEKAKTLPKAELPPPKTIAASAAAGDVSELAEVFSKGFEVDDVEWDELIRRSN